METKVNNSENNKVENAEKRKQNISVSFTVRAFIENANRLKGAELITENDLVKIKEIGTRATMKGLGL